MACIPRPMVSWGLSLIVPVRFEKRRDLDFGLKVRNVRRWVAHVLTTTTVNIGASTVDTKSVVEEGNEFPTPKGLFYNEDCLHLLLGEHGGVVRSPSYQKFVYFVPAKIIFHRSQTLDMSAQISIRTESRRWASKF